MEYGEKSKDIDLNSKINQIEMTYKTTAMNNCRIWFLSRTQKIFNNIDYILCQKKTQQILQNWNHAERFVSHHGTE